MYKLPPIPTPPVTIKAPEEVDIEEVDAVTANPDTLNMLAVGLKPKDVIEETAIPEPVPCGENNTGL